MTDDYDVKNTLAKELGHLYSSMSAEQLRHIYLITLQIAKKWGTV